MADLLSVLQGNAQGPAPGWGSLGAALVGSNRDAAYNRGMAQAAQLDQLVQTARMTRNKAMAQDQAAKAAQSLGLPPDLITLVQAGYDPRQLSGYTGDMQAQGFRNDAVTRATGGDWGGANAALLGVANGPVELAAVQGQNLINNRLLPGGGGISTTEQGRASMATDAARARASDASAASSYATADATRQRLGIAQAQFDLQRSGQWNPSGKQAGGAASLPVGALKELLSVEDALGGANVVNEIIQKNAGRIADGTLQISPTNSLLSKGRTALGVSTPNDVALNEYQSDLTKIVNESLRLNKGVQTEGDAQRAANELMTASDARTAAAALARLSKFNRQAVELQQRKSNLINANYGRTASPGADLNAALQGGGIRPQTGQAPAIGVVQDGFRYRGGDPSAPSSWERL